MVLNFLGMTKGNGMSRETSKGSRLKKIEDVDEKIDELTDEKESKSLGTQIAAMLIVGWLFFPFGLAFIALCRWLWPMAFPQ